jgi:hypothetical protein
VVVVKKERYDSARQVFAIQYKDSTDEKDSKQLTLGGEFVESKGVTLQDEGIGSSFISLVKRRTNFLSLSGATLGLWSWTCLPTQSSSTSRKPWLGEAECKDK